MTQKLNLPSQIILFLNFHGWKYQQVDRELMLVSGCPFCQDEKPNHFYINFQTGLWHCHRCGEGGNFPQLKKRIGEGSEDGGRVSSKLDIGEPRDASNCKIALTENRVQEYYDSLLQKKEIYKYLSQTRGLSRKTITHFKLGWDGKDIIIPIFQGKKLLGAQKRISPFSEREGMPRYSNLKGLKINLFNIDSLKKKYEVVFVFEGAMDTMSLWSQTNGRGAMVATHGAGVFKKEWKKYFKKIQKVIIIPDSDEAGQKLVENVTKILDKKRCWKLILPSEVKDMNEFFVRGYSLDDFRKLIFNSVKI